MKLSLPTRFLAISILLVSLYLVRPANADFFPGENDPLAIITVNSTGDQGDANPGDICDTTYNPNTDPPTPPSGICTLRAALGESSRDTAITTIRFDIVGSPVFLPQTSLVAGNVTIEGGMGGGSRVVLDGSLVDSSRSTGILQLSSNVTIEGLVINHGTNVGGIHISGDNNIVHSSYIGVSADGASSQGNYSYGIQVWGKNNIIGGTEPGTGNVISGNAGDGIKIGSSATGTVILGNFIGTNAAGTSAIPNTMAGINMQMASGITIGGTAGVTPGGACTGACNLISGNKYNGIDLWGAKSSPAQNNMIKGNFIGVDVTGTAVIEGQSLGGIEISSAYASNNTVGGSEPADRNLVSGGNSSGILLKTGAHHNTILGNYVGTDTTGALPLGDQTAGIVVSRSHYNTIGAARGTDDKCRGGCNLVSGNSIGIEIQNDATFNTILGNFAGLSWDGSAALPNQNEGIWIDNAQDNTVGGTDLGAGNLAAWNNKTGIGISGDKSARNRVVGNVVGTDLFGQEDRGNAGHGVFVYGTDNQVGGVQPGEGNRIAYNKENGVYIHNSSYWPSYQNRVAANSIYNNGKLGIELLNDGTPAGVTPNDPGDGDDGANDLQNYPVITKLERNGATTTITATLNSAPSTAYRVEFFNSPGCDLSGYGEGKTFLGAKDVTTGPDGNVTFTAAYANLVAVTATATDPDGNTSEFSKCFGPIIVNSSADRQDSDINDGLCFTGQNTPQGEPECTLRAAIQHANAIQGTDSILFDIPGGGTPLIQPLSALPTITDPVFLDATSQPGSGMIHLDGQSAGAGADGLHLNSTSSEIVGFSITNFSGSGINLDGGRGNKVRGCLIGVGPDPSTYMGNEVNGILIHESPENIIGGPGVANRNVISGNHATGVLIQGSSADRNQIVNNFIGLLPSGTSDRGNGGHGVLVQDGSGNQIGGYDIPEGNRIAYNHLNGVTLSGSGAVENLISHNAIYSNDAIGIDLANNGPTLNDISEDDSGENGLQNYPQFKDLSRHKNSVMGVLTSLPEHTYHLEFFASNSCDASGYGEGAEFLGDMDITTGSVGVIEFTFNTTAHLNRVITATATDPAGSTSEFSECHGLVIQDVKMEHQRVSDGAWQEIFSDGTVDGNRLRFTVVMRNRGVLPEVAELHFKNPETGQLLPDGKITRTFAPGDTSVEYLWDTSGYAWQKNKVARITPRPVEISLRQFVAGFGERLYDLKQVQLKVRPKPVILVHGWWSSADEAWATYPDMLKAMHPDWKGYAVGDGIFLGEKKMDTGSPVSFGKTINENAIIVRDYIQAARESENAWHVDILAHSKGGLISRFYVQAYMPLKLPDGKPMVSHLLMLGTPNLGSPCAINIPGMYEITYYYVQQRFNPFIFIQRGVPFSVMAGSLLDFTCTEVSPGDSVVEVTSAWGLPYVIDVDETLTLHTDMTTSEGDLEHFVMARLSLAPSEPTPDLALTRLSTSVPLQTPPSPQFIYLNPNVSLAAGQTQDFTLPVPQANSLTVVLSASQGITTTLYDPSNQQVWQVAAGSAAAKEPIRTVQIASPVAAGNWRLALNNTSGSAAPATVSASVSGNPLVVSLQPAGPDVQNRMPISVTLANSGSPATGAVVSANLDGVDGSHFTLDLLDDGQHSDGASGDGVYGNLSAVLPPSDFIITARATWNNQERISVNHATATLADLALSKTVSPEQVKVGDPQTYTLTVKNLGLSEDIGVTVMDSLPAGLAFVSADSTTGGCQEANGTITCMLALQNQQQATITIVTTVLSGGSITNTATVQGAVHDPVTTNNSAQITQSTSVNIYIPLVKR